MIQRLRTSNKKGFTLIELMIVVAILAILAVVAVPAVIKYMRCAKTTEAIDQLDKIYKSAATYYASPSVRQGDGFKLQCQFPTSQTITPDITSGICCGGSQDADQDDRCDVDVSQWDTPTWSSLNFQMNDQHYFGFLFTSNGSTMAASRFTATAHADLDCDSVYSTFERYGYGDESGTRAECSMKGSSAFYKDKETE